MLSTETDDAKMEEILLKNGFNKKNISVMKKAIIRGEDPDDTLFKIILDLKSRFIRGCFMIFILSMVLIYYIITGSSKEILVMTITIAFSFVCIYYITPMNLGWKSYFFLKNNSGV